MQEFVWISIFYFRMVGFFFLEKDFKKSWPDKQVDVQIIIQIGKLCEITVTQVISATLMLLRLWCCWKHDAFKIYNRLITHM